MIRPKTVLLVSRAYPPDVGGVEAVSARLARRFAAEPGLRVVVVTQTAAVGDETVERLRIERRPGLRRLWRLVGEADLLHLAGPANLPMLLARLRRRPLIVLHHGSQAACPSGLLWQWPEQKPCPGHWLAGRPLDCLRCQRHEVGWRAALRRLLAMPLRRWLLRGAVQLAPSHWLAGRLGLPEVQVIPHGMTAGEDEPAALDPADAPATAVPEILVVARLVREKGIDTLIEALAILRQQERAFRLRVIGDGPERPALMRLAVQAGIGDRVHFDGFQPAARVQAAGRRATVQVQPSRLGESFGLGVLEALARGTPLIVSDLGGQAELAGDAALRVPPDDPPALAAALTALLDDPGLRNTLVQAGRVRVREYPEAAMLAEHLRVVGAGLQRHE